MASSLHQPLRTYIRQNLSHLRSTPCLLINSIPPPNSNISTAIAGTKSPSSITTTTLDADQQKVQREQLKSNQAQNDKRIHSFIERNTQCITMEFGLKSVPFGISSAYPTLESVGEAVALAKRAGLKEGGSFGGGGDGVVIGIGSGAAMDLAKAVADSMFGNVSAPSSSTTTTNENENVSDGSQLVLAPCTLSGLMAASSNSPSLLLDTKEEMILPHLPSAWNNNGNGASFLKQRVGTVVTMDASHLLALPQLYTEFVPMKRTGYSVPPSMAHVAAAALAILLDAARSVDAAGASSTAAASSDNSYVKQLTSEMKDVAASCATVLHLAATVATQQPNEVNEETTKQAQQHLLQAIPRLSPLIEQSSLLLSSSSTASASKITTTGTIPQRMANVLLPTYFPQCHIVTYLACTLPGLCEVLSSSSQTTTQSSSNNNSSGAGAPMVEAVAKSIMSCIGENNNISQVVTEAGIPSMASLAYGTPDLNTLIGSLDSYESLMVGGGQDESWIMEDVLQRSLSR